MKLYYQKPDSFEKLLSISRETAEYKKLHNTYFCVYKGYVNLVENENSQSKFNIYLFSH